MNEPGGEREVARTLELRVPRIDLTGWVVIDSLPPGGRAFGGIRCASYPSRVDAFADAHRLARAMSQKCALAELPVGGAKTVLWDRGGVLATEAFEVVGEAVEQLGGAYVCGPDLGTDEPRMAAIRTRTRWANPVGNAPGPRTAQGVLAGMRGAAEVVFGSASLHGKVVGIHGLGSVGLALAERLLAQGAVIRGWDLSDAAMARAAERGVAPMSAEAELMEGTMDVFAPCAIGGVLDGRRAERLQTKLVCGSANNVLADSSAGEILDRRGVAYAPDIVVNAGAVIEGVFAVLAREGEPLAGTVDEHVEATFSRCRDVLLGARERGIPPEVEAAARAEEELTRRARSGGS